MVAEVLKMCPQESQQFPVRLKNVTTFSREQNVIAIAGNFTVSALLQSPISVEITAKRCDMRDSSRCTSFPPFVLADICVNLDTEFFGDRFVNQILPKFECPIKAVGLYKKKHILCNFPKIWNIFIFKGEYSFNGLTTDLRTIIRFVPFIEGRFMITYKFTKALGGSSNKKRVLSCVQSTIKAFTASRSRKNS